MRICAGDGLKCDYAPAALKRCLFSLHVYHYGLPHYFVYYHIDIVSKHELFLIVAAIA